MSGSALGEADKSHIIDMIFRLSGRAYLITSDTLNPSQIRFPNRPPSRLTAAFRAWNESAAPPPLQREHTCTGLASLRRDGAPAPAQPPSSDPRLFINPGDVPTCVTAPPNEVSLFSPVFFSCERREKTSVCLTDEISGEDGRRTIS